jgi:phosphatidylglycerol:prolipoprotein diacylglycerol transferase
MFGRVGCFLNGCCFGFPTLSAFKVTFPMGSFACEHYQELQPVHPVQLYESIGLGILFLFLATLVDRKRFDGQVVALYGLGYSTLRFCMEFFRGDNPPFALGFTLSQWISIVLFVGSLLLYPILNKYSLSRSR